MTASTATKRPQRNRLAERLNHHVAMAADLRSQVKQAHWNVVGPNFIALHHLFDDQATILLAHVDTFAERVRALRVAARGTVRLAAAESPLPDLEARELPEDEAVSLLLARFEAYSQSLSVAMKGAGDAEDLATQDIYIEAQRQIDLHAYFLRSHLGVDGAIPAVSKTSKATAVRSPRTAPVTGAGRHRSNARAATAKR